MRAQQQRAQRARADTLGLGVLYDDPPPLTEDARAALHCWNWLGGWQPALLPCYAALYPLEDPEMMSEWLTAIRDAWSADD